MSIVLVRVDDRLIHGQVVVGWAQALSADRIVLVDDAVAESAWERQLYALGVPPGLELTFVSVADAVPMVPQWMGGKERVLMLLGSVGTAVRLSEGARDIRALNLGGLHNGQGRTQRLSYVYLSDDEGRALARLSERGVLITAQDVPTARRVPLKELL